MAVYLRQTAVRGKRSCRRVEPAGGLLKTAHVEVRGEQSILQYKAIAYQTYLRCFRLCV